jgi:hypothetical protein
LHRVRAFVRWVRDGQIGLTSATKSCSADAPLANVSIAPISGPDARREPRACVSAAIPLRELGQGAAKAQLVNLSSHGFMAETEA